MKNTLETIYEWIMITIATAIVAAAVFFFLIPSHVSVGSISGLAIVIGNFISMPISVITMVLNVGLLVIGFIFVGREFGGKTVKNNEKYFFENKKLKISLEPFSGIILKVK